MHLSRAANLSGQRSSINMRRTLSEQIWSAALHEADLSERCRHFAFGPRAAHALQQARRLI
jgi:hypothetical protein